MKNNIILCLEGASVYNAFLWMSAGEGLGDLPIVISVISLTTFFVLEKLRTSRKERKRMHEVNRNTITLEDCIDNFEKKGEATVIFDGQVVDFVKEK